MPRPRRSLPILCIAFCMGLAHAQALNPSAPLGKQRAAASRLEWDAKDASHSVLGSIRVATMRTPVETAIGSSKVLTRMSVACLKGTRVLAIELTNNTPEDKKGLKPNKDPRLVCTRPAEPGSEKLVQEELLSNWDVTDAGDTLAQGFRAFPLRECVSIRVVQEVALPAGWAQKSAKVEFDFAPYNRQVDDVFASCGDVSAYDAPAPATTKVAAAPAAPAKVAQAQPTPAKVTAPAPAPPKVSPPPAAFAPAPAPAKVSASPSAPAKVATAPTPTTAPPVTKTQAPAQPAPAPQPQPATKTAPAPAKAGAAAPDGWLNARALSTGGRTNVRATPSTQAAVVIQLDPGTPLLAQSTGTDWYRVKAAPGGAPFEGFIRQDRLAFR